MDKLFGMHEEIGTVKWFGDSTKQKPHSDYGYITRTENPERNDIKFYGKGLDCSIDIDKIKEQKGLLVHFNVGSYKGKEEAINVCPVQVTGYIQKFSYNRCTSWRVVVDTSLAIGKKVEKILFINKEELRKQNFYNPQELLSSLLWEHTSNNQILISQFRIFKFDAKGLLRGQTDINDNLKTIIAYCGGYIKEKGYCGFSPLIFGQQSTCPKCGYLICSNKKCGYCKCKRKV